MQVGLVALNWLKQSNFGIAPLNVVRWFEICLLNMTAKRKRQNGKKKKKKKKKTTKT